MNPEEILAELFFRAFIVTICSVVGKDAEAVLKAFGEHIRRVQREVQATHASWDSAPSLPVAELRSTSALYRPARLRATVASMSEPVLVTALVGDAAMQTLQAGCTLRDHVGDQIRTVALIDEEMIKFVVKEMRARPELEFLGRVVPVPVVMGGPAFELRFAVEKVRPVESALQLVDASAEEIAEAEQTLRALAERGQTPLEYIKAQLVDGLGIVGLESHDGLDLAIEFVILQALSGGTIGNTSGKLHALVMGAPGVGKKLLTVAARVVNIRFREGHPTKLTEAGLVGATMLAAGGFKSAPGFLPLAHMGTFAVQDGHSIPSRSRAGVYSGLSMVMEDGVAADSTAARASFEAETAILLDLNRQSDLGRSARDPLSDTGIPLNILSRFDLITIFPADAERQATVAAALHSRLSASSTMRRRLDDEPWVRQLRVMVAVLRDRPEPKVSVVEDQVRQAHLDLIHANQGVLALSDFQTRLANSVWKLVRTICRAWQLDVPDGRVVAAAYEYVRPKVEFLKTVDPRVVVPSSWSKPDRQQWFRDEFTGTPVTPEDAVHRYREATGHEVSDRTVRRDFEALGARRVGRGRFLLPPAAAEDAA